MQIKTPVVLIIYNRPYQTKIVFDAIKKIKPATLFIIADGPKNNADIPLCKDAQSIINEIDWEVNLQLIISEQNMGCFNRITSGLEIVFNQVETAIILEDDCLPHETFFMYCEQLLSYYKNDESVMHISGCNILQEVTSEYSYFFSNYVIPPWGWATWAKAWQKFNMNLDTWQKHKKEIFHHISQNNFSKWTDTFEHIRINRNAWDIPWNNDIWANKGLGIIPAVNLVRNIGFDEEATFTKKSTSLFSNLPFHEMHFPLIHPGSKTTSYDKEIETACIAILNEI